MPVYKDISLSFDLNQYNDIPILTDRSAIINTFKNNLLINSNERHFDNRDLVSIKSLLNKNYNSAITDEYLEELLEYTANQDERIDKILNFDYNFNENNYTLDLSVTLQLNISIDRRGTNILYFNIFLKDI